MTGAWTLFQRLVREHLRAPEAVVLAVAAGLGLAVVRLRLTWLLGDWAEGPLLRGATRPPPSLLVETVLLVLVLAVLLFVSRYELARVREATARHLRERIASRLLHADLARRRASPDGDLVARLVGDVAALGGFVAQVLKRYVADVAVMVGATLLTFLLSWRLALLLLLVGPACAWLLARASGRLRRAGAGAQAAMGDLGAVLSEQMQGHTTVKALQTEDVETRRFETASRRYRGELVRGETWSAAVVSAVWLFTGVVTLVLVGVGAGEVKSGRLTAGELLALCVFAGQAIEPVRRLGEAHATLQLSLGAAARIFEVLDMPAERWPARGEPGDATGRPPDRPAAVRFEGVRFGYTQDNDVLRGVDLDVRPGERLALVGETGGGKTTLGWLLAGLLQPSAGRVTLDGQDLRTIGLADLRRQVSLVEQEPFVLGGTIRDNVAYGSWEASAPEVEAAIAAAGLAGGADEIVAESGRDLSGGEKQRVAIARALLRRSRVMVLDEATSALDVSAEERLFAAARPWLEGRTVIVISHRAATVARCDRVAVLERGRVRAIGTWAELAGDPGLAVLFESAGRA